MSTAVKAAACLLIASALALPGGVAAQSRLGPADRRAVLSGIADLIERRYVSDDTGRTLAAELRRDAEGDRWADVTDPSAFATTLTSHLRERADDGHLGLSDSEKPLPDDAGSAERTFTAAQMDRDYGPQSNYGFEQGGASRATSATSICVSLRRRRPLARWPRPP